MRTRFRGAVLFMITTLIAACAMPFGTSQSPPSTPASPHPMRRSVPGNKNALIYAGVSSWGAEVDSLASILQEHGVGYQEVSSAELDALSLDDLSKFQLLIIPGGDAPTITKSLSRETHSRLREAVQAQGLSYLGFCAGAWLAVSPAPAPGQDTAYGIGFVDGPIQTQNYLSKQGKEFAIANALFADGSKRNLLWYGGPITPDIPGGVIARYPDGTPAITQIWSGKGFVIVSGLHPAATQAVFDFLGVTNPDGTAFDFAWKLLDAALEQIPLNAF